MKIAMRKTFRALILIFFYFAIVCTAVEGSPLVPMVPVLPINEVRPGMKGEVHTVVKGTEVVSFPAEVLSIVPQSDHPKQLILIRTSGPLVERIGGIAAGMSGSPFFINGKLVGAVGYGWEFSDHRLGLVTPIEEMASVLDWPEVVPPFGLPSPPQKKRLPEESISEVGTKMAPLVTSGISARGARLIGNSLNLDAISLPPTSEGGLPVEYKASLKPGDSVGALLAWGDITVGATGTLTAVGKDGRFVAFAHPFLNRGSVAYPLSRSWVHEVIPSVRSPFKLGTPISIVGMITQDRPQGIGGRLGSFPPAVEVSLRFRDQDTGAEVAKRFQMVDDSFLISEVTPGAVMGLLDDLWGRVGEGTIQFTFTVEGGGFPGRFSMRNVFFSDKDTAQTLANEIKSLVSIFTLNRFQEIRPLGFHLDVEVTRLPKILYIENLEVEKWSVKPGDEIPIKVTLRPYRGEAQVRNFSLRVPEGTSGRCEVVVRGGGIAEPEQRSLYEGWRSISSMAQLLKELEAKESNDQIIIELLRYEGTGKGVDSEIEEEPELVSEMKEKRMKEGSLRVFRSSYYVEGLLRKVVMVEGEKTEEVEE
ncbi:MAG: hypothetical protein PWR28_637 [Synergistaceae bacterium]|nr:hypothetical protein [Synergistaceae bacterium]